MTKRYLFRVTDHSILDYQKESHSIIDALQYYSWRTLRGKYAGNFPYHLVTDLGIASISVDPKHHQTVASLLRALYANK
jgi:hypothetical protein